MNVSKRHIMLAFMMLVLYFACSTPKQTTIQLPSDGDFFDMLSSYNLHEKDNKGFAPSAQLIKYEVASSLYSDYSAKDRYLYLPKGQKLELREDGHFDWPEGSVLVKNFQYTEAQVGEHTLLETRLLIKEKDQWKAISYQWDEDRSDAKKSKLGDIIPMEITQDDEQLSFDYIIPNKNQCKSCHNSHDRIEPIGFRYANIDKKIMLDGKEVSQIQHLKEKGILKSSYEIETPAKMVAYEDETQDLHERALAYLDINCGHCHRPNGPGNTSGLYLQYDETRSNHLGICKPPVAAGKGAGGRKFDIQPGDADASILYYRMLTREPGEMMPEIGRALIHQEGLELVAAWINGLDGNCE